MANWSGHAGYFGGAEQYAKAIKEKESRGEKLSDAAAAASFKQSHPEYFGGGAAAGAGGGGRSSTGAGGGSAGRSGAGGGASNVAALTSQLARIKAQYEAQKAGGATDESLSGLTAEATKLRTAGASETGANVQTYGKESGWFPGWTPAGTSGEETNRLAARKLNYELEQLAGAPPEVLARYSAGADVSRAAGASEAEANKAVYGKESGWFPGWTPAGAAPPAGPPPIYNPNAAGPPPIYNPNAVVAPPAEQLQDVNTTLTELLRTAQQGANAESGPVVMQAINTVIDLIQTTENRITQMFQQQMGGVDPATQAALATLRETVQRQRENLLDDMNRRGLLQSGIWAEMEDRLNRGEQTETQRLLGDRLSNLQTQLNNALMQFGQMRIQTAQQFGIEGIKQVGEEAQRRQQSLKNLMDAAMRAQELAQSREKAFMPYTYGPTPAETLPYTTPKADTMVPYTYGMTPEEQAKLSWEREKSFIPYTYGMTPQEQASLALQSARDEWTRKYGSARLAQGAEGLELRRAEAEALTPEEARRYTTGQYALTIKDAIDKAWAQGGWGDAKSILPQVEAKVLADAGELIKGGLTYDDIDGLLDYAYNLVGGVRRPTTAGQR